MRSMSNRFIIYNTNTKKVVKVLNSPYIVDGKKGVLPDYMVELECDGNERFGRPDLKRRRWRFPWWKTCLRAVGFHDI